MRSGRSVGAAVDVVPLETNRPAMDGTPGVAAVTRRALVIGYGNSLRADDGFGWFAAERLADDPRLSDTDVLCRQQLTPELSLDISTASLVVFIDASSILAPGEVAIRILTALPGAAAWTHHLTPEALLAMSHDLYAAAPDAALVSVGADSLAPGEGLSAAVARALPVVVDIVIALIRDHGHEHHDDA